MRNWQNDLIEKCEALSDVGAHEISEKIASAAQDTCDYLDKLEDHHGVLEFMARDLLGIEHPHTDSLCDPPCGGPGSTKNGYWVCDPPCRWIPLI